MTTRHRLAFLTLMAVPALLFAPLPASAQAPAKAPATSKAPAKKTSQKQAAVAEPLPPIFDPETLGTMAVDAAVFACNETSRRMFVVLGTNDCRECRILNDVLYEPAFFGEFIQQFVPVMIDVSPNGPNVGFLKNYGVDPKRGYPVVAVFESSAVEPLITRKGEMVKMAKEGPDAIRAWIRSRFRAKEGEAPKP